MKAEKNILIAFILNFLFAVFEFVGGSVTGSVAIISDAVHDLGDAASIGISYLLEKKSRKQADEKYTYGYVRYSIIGSVITTLILLLGSVVIIYKACIRIINPIEINYDGMIIFAIVGVVVNFTAAFFTREGHSLNQKAVNLHMLEDVMGWMVVLIGAVIMRFTDLIIIDPIMSIAVSIFIFVNAVGNLKESLELFLEKTPHGINIRDIKETISRIDGVIKVHHIHIWSMDGQHNYGTMHIVTDADFREVKGKVREKLKQEGIGHVTLEMESEEEYLQE